MKNFNVLLWILLPLFLNARIWYVGPTRSFTKPSAVSQLVQNGDSVLIDAGEYKKDVCIWTAHNLSLIGIGGKAHLNAEETAYGGKAIWVIAGNFTTVDNIEFSRCSVVDKNGAGIRLEGTHLTVRNCYFHDNQDGILAGDNPNSDILIEFTEFGHNGAGDGYSHNIYINHVRSLTFQYNYVHHAYYGHEVKSRAYKNIILYNRITNEDGDASYEIDLPNGGPGLVMGNMIQQSKFSDNNSFISYGREGLSNPGPHNFTFVNNTVVNYEDRGIVLNMQSGMDSLVCYNNLFAGTLTLLSGIPKYYSNSHNIINSNIASFHFKLSDPYDYYLTSLSPGIDSGLVLNQQTLGYNLIPDMEYLHPVSSKLRINDKKPDIGCFELQQVTSIKQNTAQLISMHYLPDLNQLVVTGDLNILLPFTCQMEIINLKNSRLVVQRFDFTTPRIQLPQLVPGIYFCRIMSRNQLISGKFVVCQKT